MGHNLHIFIPSKLNFNGGGIETWLEYFVRQISLRSNYNKIYIYAFSSIDDSPKIYNLNFNEKVKFFLSPISRNNGGIFNILKYTYTHRYNLENNVAYKDHLIIVGTVYLASFLYSIKKVIKRESLKTILWIRSKTIGELKAKKSKYLYIAKKLEAFMIKDSTLIIANGRDTLDFYRSLYPEHENKMNVVFNAVNYNKWSSIQIEDYNLDKGSIRIAYLGRYVKAKGFDCYIKSIEQLEKSEYVKHLGFYSYGHGELEKNNWPLRLTDRGPFTQKELYDILQHNDVFVFLNRSENAGGLSHALLEVMAAGKLIIAWKNSIHCQILNKSNSILLHEGNILELSNMYTSLLNNIMKNNGYYNRIREEARKTAESFSIEEHIDRYLEIAE